MTVVFVHGNPETADVWGPLVERLEGRDVVLLSPPGFGAPVPDGFSATMDGYRDWLVAELEELRASSGAPVDLVGHDWGGGHVVNVAMARPDLLRSWVSDIVGVFDEDYVWHDLAQAWQTPETGEAAVAQMVGAPAADAAARLSSRGMEGGVAEKVAAGMNAAMGECILTLYRSAAQPAVARRGAELEKAAARPGLSLLATEDHMVGTDPQRRRAAERAGARTVVLEGLGHWWMTQDPQRGADVLTRFWDAL
ncbi:pimeloyl-ACP methyl ester carboxylesterase [Pseudonocardia sediminis]|uniref:Pimeloyl-ACP methyl ester carboxylesterase n=1 Tax=Pseudonocardia sediminis TaxID=1397368 RepID=A0A4Q7UZR5_PSEST|nr:alpha/beta hydrolase [Pseudonocardia sediminis]RZT87652.1 pimeloyl-ACP methyl ester carboxylesterase [Pseudonocardia sediminis]